MRTRDRERAPGGPESDRSPAAEVDATRDSSSGRRIVCKSCGTPISHTGARIRVRGEHEHVCVNPHGIPFHLGCYREARVTSMGAPTQEWTWFPGYRWQVAQCPGCTQHLGWRFTGEDLFYGLLLSRIAEVDDPPES